VAPETVPASTTPTLALHVDLSELAERVAQRVVVLLADRAQQAPEPWLNAEQAAAYIGDAPISRIYALTSKRAIPFHRNGSRVLFRASELDGFVLGGGANR
jgi:excisionase family DNA binding protein